MGTMLQARGLPPGAQPELWNLTHPDVIESVQRAYVEAGSEVLYTNTFGANALKLARTGHTVREVVTAAVRSGEDAAGGSGACRAGHRPARRAARADGPAEV